MTGLGNFPSSPTTTTVCRHEKVKNCPFLLIFTLSRIVCARACACARRYTSNFIYFLRYRWTLQTVSKSCLILSNDFKQGVSGQNFKKVSREKDCPFFPSVDNRGHFLPLFHPQNEVQKHENSSSGNYRFHYGVLALLPEHAFHDSILICLHAYIQVTLAHRKAHAYHVRELFYCHSRIYSGDANSPTRKIR